MGKSKLRTALAAEKGVDFKVLKQKKKAREARKSKTEKSKVGGAASKRTDEDEEDWEDNEESEDEQVVAEEGSDDDEDEEEEDLEMGFENDSLTSDSEVEMEEKIERPKKQKAQPAAAAKTAKTAKTNGAQGSSADENGEAHDDEEDEEEDEGEDDDEEDDGSVAWSDLEDLDEEERADLIPHQKLAINNTAALLASLKRIALPTDSSVSFQSHQSVVSSKPTADAIEDIQDDLTRELQFYAQALEAAKTARKLLRAEKVPFTRPNDYFAEMVKDDGHMEKVKAKLISEASAKKASAEARKQRDLKKFGKQVQVAKIQERAKEKKDVLEKIKSLKRKRQESTNDDLATTEADDLFDVAVDNELKGHSGGRGGGRGGRGGAGRGGMPSRVKRMKKDEKYGFGGKKRHSKSGDAVSSGDLSGFNARAMKAGGRGGRGGGAGRGRGGGKPSAARPGKARRQAARGRD